ncbi:MAG: accessory factor UbiK family protein [Beijerinckiaceae bacterium]|nr:accessory factor UbiK family protein [Beijerinckiaceae bacterium]
MSQNTNPLFDNLARLMTDAAGVASSARREVDTLVKSQIERLLRDADVVTREEFEAVREMAVLAREENEKLSTRILALEAKLGTSSKS